MPTATCVQNYRRKDQYPKFWRETLCKSKSLVACINFYWISQALECFAPKIQILFLTSEIWYIASQRALPKTLHKMKHTRTPEVLKSQEKHSG